MKLEKKMYLMRKGGAGEERFFFLNLNTSRGAINGQSWPEMVRVPQNGNLCVDLHRQKNENNQEREHESSFGITVRPS